MIKKDKNLRRIHADLDFKKRRDLIASDLQLSKKEVPTIMSEFIMIDYDRFKPFAKNYKDSLKEERSKKSKKLDKEFFQMRF